MNKHTIIVIAASIIIAGSFGFSFWNVYAADQIQIKSVNDNFSYFDLMNNGRILVCNPLPLNANFNEIKISMVYNKRDIGFLSYTQVFLDANSEVMKEGKFVSENVKEFQYNALHFDGMYSGVIPSRIDTQNMLIVTEINTSIIGFIPYSINKNYPGLQFWDLMNNQRNEYRCEF